MYSKENAKQIISIVFTCILFFKFVDNPTIFFDKILSGCLFFSPFLIGLFISLIINPLMIFFINKLKFNRLVSILLSYLLFFISFCLIFNLLIPSLVTTINSIINDIDIYTKTLSIFFDEYLTKFKFLESFLPSIQSVINNTLLNLQTFLSSVYNDLPNYIFSISSVLINLIIGIVLSVYMLLEKENLKTYCKNFLYAFTSKNKASNIINFFKTSHDIFYNYIIGQLLLASIVGLLTFVGLNFFVKVDNSLFLSFIVACSNLVPFFGPFIGGIFVVLIVLVYNPIKAFYAAIFLFIVQQIDANIIGPKIMGDYVGLSPFVVISCVLIFGEIFSFLGVFLSVPIAAVINVYLSKAIKKKLSKR